MKKIIILTLISCILISSMSAFAVAENIIIDGETITIPAEMGKVCEKDDRTFVPVRFVTEFLGCNVTFTDTDLQKGATITNPEAGVSYYFIIDSNSFLIISGDSVKTKKMDTATFLNYEEGRTYVPVRFLAEELGYKVDWEEETQTVMMTKIAE